MNAKKLGLVGAGVLTALLAASPMAFATDGHHEPSTPNKACAFQGGDAGAASEISGDTKLGNAVTQAPVGGNNAGNAGNCSEFLNNNGNGSNNSVEVLTPEAPLDAPADSPVDAPVENPLG